MFTFHTGTFLPGSEGEPYLGIAFDGCQYYLTVQSRQEIAVTDRAFRPVKAVKTSRSYSALCFDVQRNCFWAASDHREGVLFRLDRELREVDLIRLPQDGRITGVSFCCDTGRLMVSQGNRILTVDPKENNVCPVREEPGCALICTVLCLPPYSIYTVLRGRKPRLVLLDANSGRVLEETAVEADTQIRALALDPCCGKQVQLVGLGVRNSCYPVILQACLEKTLTEALKPCNMAVCRKCQEKCPPCPESCRDVLESIALQEAALAHILNGEGEKLQKAVACACSSKELLAVNKSVQRTILYVTQLEQALLSKLEAVQQIWE